MSSKEKLAFVVQIEEHYDIRRVVAKVCRVTTSGELRRPSFGSGDLGAHLADFEVSAYLDRDNERAWCPGHYFDAFRVDLEQAESIVKVLRKIQKGMDKATREHGYLAADDFAGYLFRIAAILGVRTYYVRNSDRGREMTGETFRHADAASVQVWIDAREKEFCKPREVRA